MIKEVCENVSALLTLFIFYLNKSNLSFYNKNFKWGGNIIMKSMFFLKYTLDTIIGTPRNFYE